MDRALPADEPLSPTELKQMQRHLAFIRRYRLVLRPKLNAREAQLVDGNQESMHRGTCLHLLSKIDGATIRAALEREPLVSDAAARARFLAEAAGIARDPEILLRFLESLGSVARSDETTRAFTRTLEHVDFSALSAARLGRLLDAMQRCFAGHELTGALFGLLRNQGFRQAFDQNAPALEAGVAARFLPLRAVWEACAEGRGRAARTADPAVLVEGLRTVLAAPAAMLEAWPAALRVRLLDTALRSDEAWTAQAPGARALLRGLPREEEAWPRCALAVARGLVRHGRGDDAIPLLRELGETAAEAVELLRWLEAPRLGHLALREEARADAGVQHGFHLRRLTPVLLRFLPSASRERLAEECRVQRGACLPGLCELLESGEAGGLPYAALPARGQRLDAALAARPMPLDGSAARALALAGLRIYRALGLAGIALPDASPHRFLLPESRDWSAVLLADFAGADAPGVERAGPGAARLAVSWCRGALEFPPFSGRPLRREIAGRERQAIEGALEGGASPTELAALLLG